MKLFREALIIFGIYLLGELLSSVLHLPIPGNILGMVILFILLCTKVVKVDNISNVTSFLLDHLSFFFIPAGVGLMASIGVIKINLVAIISSMYINNNNYNRRNWNYCANSLKKSKVEKT